MKRPRSLRLLLCTLALVFAAGAHAQVHQHADTTQARPMDHGGMVSMEDMQAMMPRMMRMHEHMMADSTIRQRMTADPELHAVMREMMGGEMDMDAMHEHMAAMPPDERRAMMEQMHARMAERMEAMPSDERQAMMHRMMEAHRRMMADPTVHERMRADPEMREMMQERRHGGEKHEMHRGGHDG